MRSWLRKSCVSKAASQSAAPLVTPASFATCERLEDRQFLSATAPDLTYTFSGKINFKLEGSKVRDVLTVTLVSQTETGFLSGQMSSLHGGTVDIKGNLTGKNVKLVGATSGRLIDAVINKKGKVVAGTLTNGIDKSVGKFKIKAVADAPTSLPPASRADSAGIPIVGGTVSPPVTSPPVVSPPAQSPPAVPPTGSTPDTTLDPSIDPVTGLPIDPTTGKVVDPSVDPDPFPGAPPLPDGFPTQSITAGRSIEAAATGESYSPLAVGQLIGANYSIEGIWDGQFNFDTSGQIENILTGATTGAPVNGTRPGTDPRAISFNTTMQDATGLVSGTVTIEEFGTFVYTGFVNVDEISLVLSGPGSGTIDATLNSTFDSFSGMVVNAEANGFRANGPFFATFTSGGGSGVVLPVGEELYHVDTTNSAGEQTFGNFDPNGATLGMDFSVGTTPLIINSLGAFDDGADGLARTIRVAIYNLNNTATPVVISDITTATSELAPNSNFRYLTTFTPVTLSTGIYRIVAFGYGGGELAGDIGVDTYTGPVTTANTGSTGREIVYPITNTLNANNYFSNTPATALAFPTRPAGLPINRYLAGSFLFEEGTPIDPGGGPVSPPTPVPPPPPVLTKPANSAYPGGVRGTNTGPEVFGSQSDPIIPG